MAGRGLNKLTAMQVSKLKTPGRHSDGGGLYLYVDKELSRRWVFIYVQNGKRRELGLGSAQNVGLATVRRQATAMRELLSQGKDPKTLREPAKEIPTFGSWADAYIETMRPSWRNAKHAAQWTMTLKTYAKIIRSLPVDKIGTQDVLDVLRPLWKRTPETAERLRGRIEKVLDAAKAKGLRSGENPARWRSHLDQLLPKRQRLSRGHHAALPFDELPDFVVKLQKRDAVAAWALEFTILTASRSNEVLQAQWMEVDLERGIWTIPAGRMKGGREHRVPLAPRALDLLDKAAKLGTSSFVFPGQTADRPLSSMAMAMLMRRMEVPFTVHGFRSSFRDWAAEVTDFSYEVCEMALAHKVANKVEAAYRRGDLFEKRKILMESWAVYCASANSNREVE